MTDFQDYESKTTVKARKADPGEVLVTSRGVMYPEDTDYVIQTSSGDQIIPGPDFEEHWRPLENTQPSDPEANETGPDTDGDADDSGLPPIVTPPPSAVPPSDPESGETGPDTDGDTDDTPASVEGAPTAPTQADPAQVEHPPVSNVDTTPPVDTQPPTVDVPTNSSVTPSAPTPGADTSSSVQ